MGFPDRLKQARIGMNLTQKELSKKIGVANSAISNYEKGASFPNVEILYKLFSTLNVDPNFLFQDETNVNNVTLNTEELQIIDYYRALNDIGKQKAIDSISDLAKIPEYTTKKTTADERKRRIERMPYYDVPASAGTGQYLDYSTMRMVSVDGDIPGNADYILKVSGDSMEPQFKDGEFVYVNKSPVLNTGDIGIFYYENNVYIKKYGDDGLVSLNPAYPLIPMCEDISCLGKVIGKVNGKVYF